MSVYRVTVTDEYGAMIDVVAIEAETWEQAVTDAADLIADGVGW